MGGAPKPKEAAGVVGVAGDPKENPRASGGASGAFWPKSEFEEEDGCPKPPKPVDGFSADLASIFAPNGFETEVDDPNELEVGAADDDPNPKGVGLFCPDELKGVVANGNPLFSFDSSGLLPFISIPDPLVGLSSIMISDSLFLGGVTGWAVALPPPNVNGLAVVSVPLTAEGGA